MACASPLYKFNPYTNSLSRIPCGWCMNCRVDRRTYFQDRFEFEYFKTFNGVGTFGCITYDDNHIPYGLFGDSVTLVKKDIQKFWKRVRSHMSYYKINSPMLNRNFKHYTVGEYSEDGRPHYHFIAVGLDYKLALPIYEKCWNKSVIFDSRPILDGGMSYVLKYLDKQEHGDELLKYSDAGVEPPFLVNSHNVGNKLFFDKNNVNLNDFTYFWNGRWRPLPSWVKSALWLDYQPIKNNPRISEFAKSNNMSYDDADLYLRKAKNILFERKTINSNKPVATLKSYNATRIRLQKINTVCSKFGHNEFGNGLIKFSDSVTLPTVSTAVKNILEVV